MPGTPGKPTRYKTLPARSATGDTGTKLSQQPTLAGSPGTKLSRHARNSPFRRVLPEQGELFHARAANRPCRENFVPHSGPVPVQNSPRTQPGGRYRYKTLPAYEPHALNRYKTLPAYEPHALNQYKTLPARPKTPIAAHFPHAGRVLYRFHHQQAEQGEESHAPAPHQLTLPQFRMQFDCMKFQQRLETLQFQRSQFKSRNTPTEIACEIGCGLSNEGAMDRM